jgi:hypothetical protein
MRCPADIKHSHLAQMARRLYAVTQSPEPDHLKTRMSELAEGIHEVQLDALMKMNLDELKKQYAARVIEAEGEES